jgi:dTDP-4-dehydrorhamnose 3,5-epimerase
MKLTATGIPECLILEPRVFKDDRGDFFESFNAQKISELIGNGVSFVQDNQSNSHRNVLRGLHYQIEQAQGKLVRVVSGSVYDVAVDLRRSSPTFGRWVGVHLDADSNRMFWVPPGFAHGFVVTSERATFLYKTTDYYAPQHERTLAWNDASLAIAWPVKDPILSAKDAIGQSLANADTYP